MNIISLQIATFYGGQNVVLHPSVIQSEQQTLLIDCGYEGCLKMIADELFKHNIKTSDLTGVIISHDDIDHIGGLHEIKEANPAIKIFASEIEAPYLSGEIKSLRLQQAEDMFNLMPAEHRTWAMQFQNELKAIKRIPIDQRFAFDGSLKTGIDIVNTPGHTPGHISIYLPKNKILIANDAVVVENDELEIANPQFALDLNQAIESVRKISSLEIDQLFCYHGGVVDKDVKKKLMNLLTKYQKYQDQNGRSSTVLDK
jgi:glyoxylase-like metal-dependent hydrolase (beta-lactamase superfamily II)